MRWVIACSAVVLGCGESSALEVVVEMPPSIAIDKVQLYVGLGDPQNRSSERLVPRDYAYPDVPDGLYWQRDPYGAQDVIDVQPGAHDVRFVFREGTDDRITAIVVGYRAGSVVAAASLLDAYLEAGSVRQYHVALKAASDAFPRPTPSPVTVHRWGPQATDTRCAYLEDPGGETPSIFIVDHDDRDCDGLVDDDERECLPDVYRGTQRPDREDTRCLRSDVLPNAGDAMPCVLGGPSCVDGRGEVTSCEPSTTCAPPSACLACAASNSPLDCMASLTATGGAITRIECTFHAVTKNGVPTLCPAPAMLTQRLPFLPMCDEDEPYLFWEPGQNKWVAQSFTSMGLKFTATKPTLDCAFALEASGGPVMFLPGHRSILNVQAMNGRSAALPLVIEIDSSLDCNDSLSTNECHLAGDIATTPSFLACMGSRVVEPW